MFYVYQVEDDFEAPEDLDGYDIDVAEWFYELNFFFSGAGFDEDLAVRDLIDNIYSEMGDEMPDDTIPVLFAEIDENNVIVRHDVRHVGMCVNRITKVRYNIDNGEDETVEFWD